MFLGDKRYTILVWNVWGVDIIYLYLKKGFLYLFVIIDRFSRQTVVYEVSYRMEKELTLRRLRLLSAIESRRSLKIYINISEDSHI
jgi:hypothetical protein